MKIAVVSGICKRHDAISESVLGTIKALTVGINAECMLFAYACDFDIPNFRRTDNATDLLMDAFFSNAELIIYHFGIYYELFNAILLGNGRARQIVFYHNITPKELLSQSERRLMLKSERQIISMTMADEIWAASDSNKIHLETFGITSTKIQVVPLYIKDRFSAASLLKHREGAVRVLYIGRFVESKGLADLIHAIARARMVTRTSFTVDLLGNQTFSDQRYLIGILELVSRFGLDDVIRFAGEVSDAELDSYLLRANIFAIASYHEGFCVPLIEAMNAGCIPIAYAVGNIPTLVGDLGELIEPGDWAGFGDKLSKLIDFFGDKQQLSTSTHIEVNGKIGNIGDIDMRRRNHLEQFTFRAFSARVCNHVRRMGVKEKIETAALERDEAILNRGRISS